MINILTVYGNIIVYFKLPDWVHDWEDSLVEKEGDALDVKALKVREPPIVAARSLLTMTILSRIGNLVDCFHRSAF
jgi:hypothetical protein